MADATKALSGSESQAAAQLEGIKEMVGALECDRDRLEELRDEADGYENAEESRGGRNHWAEDNKEDAEELAELEKAATIDGEEVSEEQARERIQEDPLSVEVRSDWYTLDADEDARKPGEYCILLCTGGPACRIVGDLADGEPTSARLEHQDWGTPWTEWRTNGEDEAALLTYARCFYFGE